MPHTPTKPTKPAKPNTPTRPIPKPNPGTQPGTPPPQPKPQTSAEVLQALGDTTAAICFGLNPNIKRMTFYNGGDIEISLL